MAYVVVFLAGGAVVASALFIWNLAYVARLRAENQRLQAWNAQLTDLAARLRQDTTTLETRTQEFESRKVQYDQLLGENSALKQDLFNLSVRLKKSDRDQAAIVAREDAIDQSSHALAQRYLDDNLTWISEKLTPRNFASSKNKLAKVINGCREIGFDITAEKEEALLEDLKRGYEQAVRAEFQREEQARIRAQIREEERLAREIEKQIQDAERERAAIEAALERAIKDQKHAAEIEHLRAKLKEAEERAERAKSMAEMTKAGHVYVISNVGSFGESVYKIGMTRRLEPLDRVRELGDASVPFAFDVHMMISCDDAPKLENALHREFHKQRLNRVNFRKEFFRVDLESIRRFVEANHGQVDFVADPAASEYRESLAMTDEDYAFIEQTAESVADEENVDLGGD